MVCVFAMKDEEWQDKNVSGLRWDWFVFPWKPQKMLPSRRCVLSIGFGFVLCSEKEERVGINSAAAEVSFQ